MSRRQRLGLALGSALVAGGLAVAVAPGLAGGVPPTAGFLTVVGIAALLLAATAVYARLGATTNRPAFPDVERARAHATPGDGLDRRLASLTSTSRLSGVRERRRVRERLETAAIAVLVRDGLTERAAREALANGTWTDDPHAASFFAVEAGAGVPLAAQLRALFSTEPTIRRRARHAIDALAARSGRR